MTEQAAQLCAVESELDLEALPRPVGWRMLVRPIQVQAVTAGGIHLPDQSVKAAEYLRYVAQVVSLGPQAYEHPKFLGGRWCEPGDWVLIRQYSGLAFRVKDREGEEVELRVVNDDEVLARAERPDALVL